MAFLPGPSFTPVDMNPVVSVSDAKAAVLRVPAEYATLAPSLSRSSVRFIHSVVVFWGRGKGRYGTKSPSGQTRIVGGCRMKKRRGVQTRRRGLKYIPGKAQVLKRTHTREKQSALTRLKTQGQFAHGTGGLAEARRRAPFRAIPLTPADNNVFFLLPP